LGLHAEHAHQGDAVVEVVGEGRDDAPRARRRFGLDLVQCLVLGGAGVGDLRWHGSSWLVAVGLGGSGGWVFFGRGGPARLWRRANALTRGGPTAPPSAPFRLPIVPSRPEPGRARWLPLHVGVAGGAAVAPAE